MIIIMIQQELEKLGFSAKEAAVYAASLELGPANIQTISEKAGIKRPTTYFIMEELMERGLVSSFHKGKKQFFVAENPERIKDIFDQEERTIQQKRKSFQEILPHLQSMNNKESGPIVKFYKGKESIIAMMKEYFAANKNKDAFIFFSRDDIERAFSPEELSFFLKQRTQDNIQVKSVYTCSHGDLSPSEKTKRIRLDEKDFPITCDIAVFDDKIRITSLRDRMLGISIEDREVSQSFKVIFSKLFDLLEEKNNR